MSFLPEDDVDYLMRKGLVYDLQNGPNAIIFPTFDAPPNIFARVADKIEPVSICRLAILIPDGYATTKLDSFYTMPNLVRADGSQPNCATGINGFWGQQWQFWSRHLEPTDWVVGIDSLETYILYVHAELKKA